MALGKVNFFEEIEKDMQQHTLSVFMGVLGHCFPLMEVHWKVVAATALHRI